MKKQIYKAFAKKLFGLNYERIGKNLAVCLIVFWGLHLSGLRLAVAPSVLYLMTAAVTAGVMWQALSSADHARYMKNMLMLPLHGPEFVCVYTGVLGGYALLVKTAVLWAVVFAVSPRQMTEIAVCAACACNAVFLTALIFSRKNKRTPGLPWAAGVVLVLVSVQSEMLLLAALAISGVCAAILLRKADPYDFYPQEKPSVYRTASSNRRAEGRRLLMWRYFLRYLKAHPNYMVNTFAMCILACILPQFAGQAGGRLFLPVGLAILSFHTPLCILLSCDPAFERAVHSLPGQKRAFCIPYGMFLFTVNLFVYSVFLISFWVQTGWFDTAAVWLAVLFSLIGAAGSVFLEWRFPIRNWKIESDLWHHPRKYIMPLLLVLAAGAAAYWL